LVLLFSLSSAVVISSGGPSFPFPPSHRRHYHPLFPLSSPTTETQTLIDNPKSTDFYSYSKKEDKKSGLGGSISQTVETHVD